MVTQDQSERAEGARVKIYNIQRELKNKRAIIFGEYEDLQVDTPVVIQDEHGVLYEAIVETRVLCGAVVRVTEVI